MSLCTLSLFNDTVDHTIVFIVCYSVSKQVYSVHNVITVSLHIDVHSDIATMSLYRTGAVTQYGQYEVLLHVQCIQYLTTSSSIYS